VFAVSEHDCTSEVRYPQAMEPRSPLELTAFYPYQFGGQNAEFTFYRGWFRRFASLCAEIDQILGQDKRGFEWTQVKEKFGSARFYWRMNRHRPVFIALLSPQGFSSTVRPPLAKTAAGRVALQVNEAVQRAAAATESMCICCGQSGSLRGGGWLQVLCDSHAKLGRRIPRCWLEFDEV
jgi:hypothetical protein